MVDDDANICELLRLYLTKEGYQVTVAHDGEEGLEKFNQVKPDMVLLDVMLPKMDGLEVCRRIRKLGNTPVMRLTAKGESPQDCQERMAPLFWDVRSRLGDCLYGVDVSSLEEVVITRLRQKGLPLSAAESCTGGLLAKRLTDVPGASAAFLGGVVSYTNAVKAGVLGVPRDLLEQYGPVSEPVARAMAEGVRRLTGSDLAVSVTGLAGPDGDDRGNPAGTVYVGLSWQGGSLVRRLALGGDRPRIRLLAASSALDIIRRHLCDLPIEQE